MKKRLFAAFLTAAMSAALLAGCGGSGSSGGSAAPTGGSEGKVINIYSWNNEFQTRVEAVYDKVDHTSEDGTVTFLTDGCEIHWVINPNTNGVYQQKLDEALLKQGSAAADEKVDLFLSETDYVVKYTDADVDVAIPLTELGIDPATDLKDQYDYTKVVASDANGVQRGTTWQGCPCLLVYRRDIAKDVFGTDNPEHVKEIMLALTGNSDNMDKITREYTEFTNNRAVMDAVANDETFGSEFLGGENPFKYFAPAAEGISMTTLSPYDQGCVELIQSGFGDYFQGQIDFERAKVNFETAIREHHPDITEIVWPS